MCCLPVSHLRQLPGLCELGSHSPRMAEQKVIPWDHPASHVLQPCDREPLGMGPCFSVRAGQPTLTIPGPLATCRGSNPQVAWRPLAFPHWRHGCPSVCLNPVRVTLAGVLDPPLLIQPRANGKRAGEDPGSLASVQETCLCHGYLGEQTKGWKRSLVLYYFLSNQMKIKKYCKKSISLKFKLFH